MRSNVNFILFILIFHFSCSKESQTELILSSEESLVETSVDVLQGLPVSVHNGILRFESPEDFYSALSILDTLSDESREMWEHEIGFHSLRSSYESFINDFIEGDFSEVNLTTEIISTGRGLPRFKNYTIYSSSVLNDRGFVYVGNAVGSLRRDGCYWSLNGNEEELSELIISKNHDPANGLLAIEPPVLEENNSRDCTLGTVNQRYDENHWIDNGNSTGSYGLGGEVYYDYLAAPANGSGTIYYIKVFFRMTGKSNKKTWRGWRRKRADHTFSWNFRINNQKYTNESVPRWVSNTYIDYNGTETHFDNELAVKEIVIEEGYFPSSHIDTDRYILVIINSGGIGSGTSQTINNLSPDFITYGCM